MNSGAIEFSESKWVNMTTNESVDLICWLNDNLEPGYQIYKQATGKTYFVGESDTLFDSSNFNQKYPIYEISQKDAEFVITKTVCVLNL